MLLIKLCVVYFEGFKTTARLACKLCMIKTLIKSDLYISVTEYYEIIASYSCMRLINDEIMKKKKKRLSRKVEDTYTICSGASNGELV